MFISKLKRDVNVREGNLGPQQILKTFIIKYLFSLYVLLLKPALPSYTIYSPILSTLHPWHFMSLPP